MARSKQKFKDTGIELKIEAVLKSMRLKYVKQYRINGLLDVDFYLPARNLVIECDGNYYHANITTHPRGRTGARRRAKDYARTQTMLSMGYSVLRIWEHEINGSTHAKLKRKIASVI